MADAVAQLRTAVRRCLAAHHPSGPLLVALSGGPDSLALAVAVAGVAGDRARAVVIDHGVQPGSEQVAQAAAAQAVGLGLAARVITVSVGTDGGPEAAARHARYRALAADAATDDAAVLLGHTRDDQAETVLLAMARGSGTRSSAGMAQRLERDGAVFLRPLLAVPRAVTAAACAEAGVAPWIDPHNADPRFSRSRLRALLPDLSAVLGPGVVAGLARTADLARDDADALDGWADRVWEECLVEPGDEDAAPALALAVDRVAAEPAAVRRRLLRRAALTAGSPAGALTAAHLDRLDAFIVGWRGQGPALLPGPVRVWRRCGRLLLAAAEGIDRGR